MDDERAIRELILSWMTATLAGDVAHLKLLMAEDVVFLTAGQASMRGRDAFAGAFAAALKKFEIHPISDIPSSLDCQRRHPAKTRRLRHAEGTHLPRPCGPRARGAS